MNVNKARQSIDRVKV